MPHDTPPHLVPVELDPAIPGIGPGPDAGWLPDGAPGSLVLEDGSVFPGRVAGRMRPTTGEAVFTTAMGGYPEAMTDPSFRGQILVFTYPEIGIYGVNPSLVESRGIYARALVVHRICRHPSLAGGYLPFLEAVADSGRGVLEGVDTRALARRLRKRGTMRAALVGGTPGPEDARRIVAEWPAADTSPLAAGIQGPVVTGDPVRIALVDFGVKDGIRASLEALGASVEIYSPERGIDSILGARPDGVLLSNGPGDPGVMDEAVDLVRGLLGKLPVMGVCLGHQLLGRALGGTTEKLPFGHRGVNQPVRDLVRDEVYLTSQNHGYAVSRSIENLPGVRITHVHAGDGSVEGIAHESLGCHSVQFHPEARPGPRDAAFLFENFVADLKRRRVSGTLRFRGPEAEP